MGRKAGPASKKKQVEEDVEIELKEEIESDDEPSSRRRSSRAPKPVMKKSVKDVSDSEEEGSEEDSDSDTEPKKKGRGRPPAKKGTPGRKPNGAAPAKRKLSSGGGNKSKKSKKDSEDEDFSGEEDEDVSGEEGEEDDEIGEIKRANKAKSTGGKGKDQEQDDDDDDNFNFDNIEDGEELNGEDWVEPKYKDKDWFMDNCLACQVCDKKFSKTGDALKCFHKHKAVLRCYICFTIIKGGKDATKKLFKHYINRHTKGDKASTLKCVHCDQSVSFKSVSCHVISVHFREALGISEKPATAEKEKSKGGKGKKKGKAQGSDGEDEEEEEVEEEEEEEQDEENEDDDDAEEDSE